MTNKYLHVNILIRYLLPIYLLAIVLLTLFRFVFLAHFHPDFILLYGSWSEFAPILLKAFVKGMRYDIIIISYLMALPLLTLTLFWILNTQAKLFVKLSRAYFIIVFIALFALACLDFPYFEYFWTHPTVTVFDWIGFGGTFGMLLQETSYYIYYLLFLLAWGVMVVANIVCGRRALKERSRSVILENRVVQTCLLFGALIFCFLGTRGHMSIKPLDINAAYFTDYKLVSDFCVTPAYHFFAYINDYEVNFDELLDADKALEEVQSHVNAHQNTTFNHPLSRQIYADSTRQTYRYNIVLVFMESLSADLMHQEVGGRRLTPFLDSLANASYYFENFFSSGVHTNIGVASTYTSYPSRFNKHMMGRQPLAYKGLSTVLKEKSYHNLFFIPNEEEYDNMGLFLRKNGIDTIFSDKHYRKEDKVNNFGVPDHFLFDFAIDELSESAEEPFFAGILTVSNHPPYVVPDEYISISDRDDERILSYVDASLSSFMKKASAQDWYKNTIFVFQGDHGKMASNQIYSMPLSYNHIPLIIYCPAFDDMPKKFNQYGGQIDIYPTVMGILNESYVNNTMGIDLLKEKRPYMFFSSDTHLGCIDDDYFYVFNPKDKSEYLYDRTKEDGTNVIYDNRDVADDMKLYALSMLATANALENEKIVELY